MKRRNFIKLAGLSSVAVSCGAVVFRLSHWWDQMPAAEFEVLSDEEAAIVAAISDALFPGDVGTPPMPNGLEVGMVAKFDAYLAGSEPMAADALRLILHAIDDMAVFADFGLTRFHKRSRADRIQVLRAWDTSSMMVRRSGFRALKYVLSNQYCNDPKVLGAAGIHYTCGGAA
ncbi:MAG: gluconate 2-dehydrogenase subunit 3 family protein [Persicimonas sp.]